MKVNLIKMLDDFFEEMISKTSDLDAMKDYFLKQMPPFIKDCVRVMLEEREKKEKIQQAQTDVDAFLNGWEAIKKSFEEK